MRLFIIIIFSFINVYAASISRTQSLRSSQVLDINKPIDIFLSLKGIEIIYRKVTDANNRWEISVNKFLGNSQAITIEENLLHSKSENSVLDEKCDYSWIIRGKSEGEAFINLKYCNDQQKLDEQRIKITVSRNANQN